MSSPTSNSDPFRPDNRNISVPAQKEEVFQGLARSDWGYREHMISKVNAQLVEVEKSNRTARIMHVVSIILTVLAVCAMIAMPIASFFGAPTWVAYVVSLVGGLGFFMAGAKLAQKRDAILQKKMDIQKHKDELIRGVIKPQEKQPKIREKIKKANAQEELREKLGLQPAKKAYDPTIADRLLLDSPLHLINNLMMVDQEQMKLDMLWRQVGQHVSGLKRENITTNNPNLFNDLQNISSQALLSNGEIDPNFLSGSPIEEIIHSAKSLCGLGIQATKELMHHFDELDQSTSSLFFLPEELFIPKGYSEVRLKSSTLSLSLHNLLHKLEDASSLEERFDCVQEIKTLNMTASLRSMLASIEQAKSSVVQHAFSLPEAKLDDYGKAIRYMQKLLDEAEDNGLSKKTNAALKEEGKALIEQGKNKLSALKDRYTKFINDNHAHEDISSKVQSLLAHDATGGSAIDPATIESWLEDMKALTADLSAERIATASSEYASLTAEIKDFYQEALTPVEEVFQKLQGSVLRAAWKEMKQKFFTSESSKHKQVATLSLENKKDRVTLTEDLQHLLSQVNSINQNTHLNDDQKIQALKEVLLFSNYSKTIDDLSKALRQSSQEQIESLSLDPKVFTKDLETYFQEQTDEIRRAGILPLPIHVKTSFDRQKDKIASLIASAQKYLKTFNILKAVVPFLGSIITIILIVVNSFISFGFLPLLLSGVFLLMMVGSKGLEYLVKRQEKKISILETQEDLLLSGQTNIKAVPNSLEKLKDVKDIEGRLHLEGLHRVWAKEHVEKQEVPNPFASDRYILEKPKSFKSLLFSSKKQYVAPSLTETALANVGYSQADIEKMKAITVRRNEVSANINDLDSQLDAIAEKDMAYETSMKELYKHSRSKPFEEQKVANQQTMDALESFFQTTREEANIMASAAGEVEKASTDDDKKIFNDTCIEAKEKILAIIGRGNRIPLSRQQLNQVKTILTALPLEVLVGTKKFLEEEKISVTPSLSLFGYSLKRKIIEINGSLATTSNETLKTLQTNIHSLSEDELETLNIVLDAEVTLDKSLKDLLVAKPISSEDLWDKISDLSKDLKPFFDQEPPFEMNDTTNVLPTIKGLAVKLQELKQLKEKLQEVENSKVSFVKTDLEVQKLSKILSETAAKKKIEVKKDRASYYQKMEQLIDLAKETEKDKVQHIQNQNKALFAKVRNFVKNSAKDEGPHRQQELEALLNQLTKLPEAFLNYEINRYSLQLTTAIEEYHSLKTKESVLARSERIFIEKHADPQSQLGELQQLRRAAAQNKKEIHFLTDLLKNEELFLQLELQWIYESYPSSPYYYQFRDETGMLKIDELINKKTEQALLIQAKTSKMKTKYKEPGLQQEKKDLIKANYVKLQEAYNILKMQRNYLRDNKTTIINKFSLRQGLN